MRKLKIAIRAFALICPKCGGDVTTDGEDVYSDAAWPQVNTLNCESCGTLSEVPHEKIHKMFQRSK